MTTKEFNLSEKIGLPFERGILNNAIKVEDVKEFVRLLKEEPTDKINSAEVFLLEYGYGNLVLNEVMSKDKWIYVSDIMIAFLKWKTDTLAGKSLVEEKE